jgi:hypothetical protein
MIIEKLENNQKLLVSLLINARDARRRCVLKEGETGDLKNVAYCSSNTGAPANYRVRQKHLTLFF